MPDEPDNQSPIHEGDEPERRNHGNADEEFASVVFDEAFVRAATVHEPTAVERLLAAAQARAEASEAEARRGPTRGPRGDDERYDDFRPDGRHDFGHDPDLDDFDDRDDLDGRYGHGSYGGQARWHRPVAWMLALLMGVGMVALAFTAVYRGASSNRQPQVPPPASTGVGQGSGMRPSASADYSQPPVPAEPRTP